MANAFELTAEFRDDMGKGASRRLRRSGRIPAILYGGGQEPRSITLNEGQLLHNMESEAFYSRVLNIRIGKQDQDCVLKDVQRHPARRRVLHVDLQRVVAGEEIRMTVPLHFIGEDVAPGVKVGGSVFHISTEVEITCLPKDLPEYIDVDVSEVELDQALFLSDLVLPEGVRVPQLVQGDEYNRPVVSIRHAKVEAVEEEVPTEEAAEEGAAEVPAGEEPGEESPSEG